MKLRTSLRMLLCGLVIGLSFFGNCKSALAITYNVNQTIGLSTVTGYIQTDGTIGALSHSNLTDWTLTVNFNSGATVSTLLGPLSGNNSDVLIPFALVNSFSATDSQLLFDFGNSFFSRVVFFNTDVLFPLTVVRFLSSEGATIGGVPHGLAQTEYMAACCTDLFINGVFIPGTQVIGDATTPLPAALPLFAGGVSVLGLLGWRRKKNW